MAKEIVIPTISRDLELNRSVSTAAGFKKIELGLSRSERFERLERNLPWVYEEEMGEFFPEGFSGLLSAVSESYPMGISFTLTPKLSDEYQKVPVGLNSLFRGRSAFEARTYLIDKKGNLSNIMDAKRVMVYKAALNAAVKVADFFKLGTPQHSGIYLIGEKKIPFRVFETKGKSIFMNMVNGIISVGGEKNEFMELAPEKFSYGETRFRPDWGDNPKNYVRY